jgi:hypothetical protein
MNQQNILDMCFHPLDKSILFICMKEYIFVCKINTSNLGFSVEKIISNYKNIVKFKWDLRAE